jgi:lactate racemase
MKRTIQIGYGLERIAFDCDPEQFKLLEQSEADKRALTDKEISEALNHPITSQPLENIVGSRDKVVIVVPDATRAAGIARITGLLVQRLRDHALPDRNISILIGGGIHRPPTPTEVRAIVGPSISETIATYDHVARDPAAQAFLGLTSRGTRVLVNRRLVETDHVILCGGICFHYIAGFSGGRKAVVPGCGAEETIQATHLLSFDRDTLEKHPAIASGNLAGNPVHENMEEAVAMLNPSFLVNTVLNRRNEISDIYAGDWREAHRRGCMDYAASHTVKFCTRSPLVIVSTGGAPSDVNLIQSHKAMEHAATLLEEDGTMVVVAECAQGLGRDDFLDWFVPGGSRATALRLLKNYHINGQTAWGLRRKTERFRIRLVSTLDADMVAFMGMEPHPTLESALKGLPQTYGYVLPSGVSTLPLSELLGVAV